MPFFQKVLKVFDFIEREVSFHVSGIELDAQEFEASGGSFDFGILKVKTKLLPQSETPVEHFGNQIMWKMRGKNSKEIIKIMAKLGWHVPLNDPMESFGEKVENVRHRAKAKGQNNVIIEFLLPGEA